MAGAGDAAKLCLQHASLPNLGSVARRYEAKKVTKVTTYSQDGMPSFKRPILPRNLIFQTVLEVSHHDWAQGEPVLSEVTFRDSLQKPKKRLALLRGHLPPDTLIGGLPSFDEPFPVFASFGCQLDSNCSARFCFVLRYESFLGHCLDRPVHDGPVEAQERGDLIRIQRCSPAQCRQDKAACRRALGFLLQSLPHREIRRCDMGEYGVFQNVVGNLFPGEDVHRTVTVASRGLRHCGGSWWVRDFFPIAITITISWCRPDNPRN